MPLDRNVCTLIVGDAHQRTAGIAVKRRRRRRGAGTNRVRCVGRRVRARRRAVGVHRRRRGDRVFRGGGRAACERLREDERMGVELGRKRRHRCAGEELHLVVLELELVRLECRSRSGRGGVHWRRRNVGLALARLGRAQDLLGRHLLRQRRLQQPKAFFALFRERSVHRPRKRVVALLTREETVA